MRDLLPRNMGIGKDEEAESVEESNRLLETNIERYRAQGFRVDRLKELFDRKPEEVEKGIAEYREAVKRLNTAQTVLRSLEPYGYSDEIGDIMSRCDDPELADTVLSEAEALKDRAFSEHEIKTQKKETVPETPGRKDIEGVNTLDGVTGKEAPKPDVTSENTENSGIDLDIDDSDLDGLLGELDDLEGAFGEDIEPPPAETGEETPPETGNAPTSSGEAGPPAPERGEGPDPRSDEGVVTGVGAGNVGAPDKEQKSIGELMELAKDAYRKGDYQRSLELFQEVVTLDPNNSKARFMLRRITQKI